MFLLPLFLLIWGCSIINSTNQNKNSPNNSSIEKSNTTNNLFCDRTLKLLDWWTIISENEQEVVIKTNYKDTKEYDVYIKWKIWNNRDIILEEFKEWNSIANISCAPWVCYGVKIDESTMCPFYRTIYSKQPQPVDFPNNDWAWYPTINDYDTIANLIWEIL